MPPPFPYLAHGRSRDGVAFVTDGAIVLRADLVAGVAGSGARELSAEQLALSLEAAQGARARLADLVPAAPGIFRTSDGVAIAEKYVRLLLTIGRPLELATSGPRGVIVLL